MEFFLCNNRKIAVKSTVHQNTAVSKSLLGEFENHWSEASILNPQSYCNPRRHNALGQTTKQPLSDFEPRKPWKYKQPGLILVAYKMYVVIVKVKHIIT